MRIAVIVKREVAHLFRTTCAAGFDDEILGSATVCAEGELSNFCKAVG